MTEIATRRPYTCQGCRQTRTETRRALVTLPDQPTVLLQGELCPACWQEYESDGFEVAPWRKR